MAHRIGILGLGSMGERMARGMRQHAGFAVVTACDPDPGAAAKLARLAPQARLVAEAAELAADPAVDCLYIATPPARHLAHAHLAFDRGKAVFCEKPLATDLALAQAAVDRAERGHRVAAVNFPFASAPAVRTLASGLRSGELGGIEHVDIEVAFARWPRPQQETAHWLGRREEGGFVREVLSHFIFINGAWLEIDISEGSIRERSRRAQLDALDAMLAGRPHSLPSPREGADGARMHRSHACRLD